METPTKVDANLKTEGYFDTFEATINANLRPMMNKVFRNSDRCLTSLETVFLPTIITIGLINWPYALFYKMGTFLFSGVLITRFMNKTAEPESPETYLREMIHTHSQLKELFKVETTTTLDFKLDYVKKYPDVGKFPEFNN